MNLDGLNFPKIALPYSYTRSTMYLVLDWVSSLLPCMYRRQHPLQVMQGKRKFRSGGPKDAGGEEKCKVSTKEKGAESNDAEMRVE